MLNLRLVGPRLEKKVKHRGNPTFNREDIVGNDLNISKCNGEGGGGNLASACLTFWDHWLREEDMHRGRQYYQHHLGTILWVWT